MLLAIVLAISALITTVQTRRNMTAVVEGLENGPEFKLEDGRFSFSGTMPYRLGGGDDPLVIIDTTGQTTESVLSNEGSGSVLVTADAMYHVQTFGQVERVDFARFPLTLTKADVIRLLHRLPVLVGFGYLFIYIGQLAFKALDALILGWAAVLYGRSVGRKVDFELGFKLGLYAMSMPLLIQWLVPGFTTLSRWGFLLWWALALFYLIFGLRAHFAEHEEPNSL